MDSAGGFLGKRSFSELQETALRLPEEDSELPAKKRTRMKLVQRFDQLLSKKDGRMKIYLRIKPFTGDEDSSEKCLEIKEEENAIITSAPTKSHSYKSIKRGLANPSHKFTFSRIFNESTSQKEFFNHTMLSMTEDFISGQNSLVFTYGVTSSGKTYTIQGTPQNAGLLPRCLDVVFNSISGKQLPELTLKPIMFNDVQELTPEMAAAEKLLKEKTLRLSVSDDTTVMTLLGEEMESVLSDATDTSSFPDDPLPDVENRDREDLKVEVEDHGKIRYSVWVSFAEIYNEQVFDLLEPMPRKKNSRRQVLRICEDKNGNPYIKGLKEINCDSADDAYRLLIIGQRNLQTACTRLNHCSSRSHCIFNIKIVRVVDKDVAKVSMLSLCDLAGSERYSKTQATGDRLKEAGNINTSLMTLGRCIETLRHNQVHKDQQKMVPFRDSRLTRLLQSFFNGTGKAAMIVNVSQCVSMFDDTLNVFKFSAIAKQVKYIEKPMKLPPVPKKKVVPPSQRPSIAWETKEAEDAAECLPIVIDDEDEESEEEEEDSGSGSESSETIKELRGYIKTLEIRNERLVEMAQDEMAVNENLMKEKDEIVETYSNLLKASQEEAQELSDKRVQSIMDIYEKRLERVQTKIDNDDEWVSSLLYHQEKMKVEEREKKIKDLEAQVQELEKKAEQNVPEQSADDSINLKNAVLVDTLTQRLEEALADSKEKDSKIEELESLLTEAGEVYNKHIEDIAELSQTVTEQRKRLDMQKLTIQSLEDQLKQSTASLEETIQQLKADLETNKEETALKMKSKDATIASLEEECRELQSEIENLQDQMSQIDEQSRIQNALDTSGASSSSKSSRVSVSNKDKEKSSSSKELSEENESLKMKIKESSLEKESLMTDKEKLKEEMSEIKKREEELTAELEKVKQQLEQSSKEKESILQDQEKLNAEIAELRKTEQELISEVEQLKHQSEDEENDKHQEITQLKLHIAQYTEENGKLQSELESLTSSLKDKDQQIRSLEEELKKLKKNNDEINSVLKQASSDNNEQTSVLQQQISQLKSELETLQKEAEVSKNQDRASQSKGGEMNITDMVRQIEHKTPPVKKEIETPMVADDEDDEIVFNPASLPMLNTPEIKVDLSTKLKEAELANVALRSKLKREEDDYFKREQALIHGFTAEIDTLKYELAKVKSKDAPSKTRAVKGKRKMNALDETTSSLLSDSVFESTGSETDFARKASKTEETESADVALSLVSNELNTVQQQYLSLSSAYQQLQQIMAKNKKGRFSSCPAGKVNESNSFIQDVILGTPKRLSVMKDAVKSEFIVTDSVLQFENEEFAIDLEEFKLKISQQEQELQTKEEALKEERQQRTKLESMLKEAQDSKAQEDNETTAIVAQLKETLETTIESKNELQQTIEELKENLLKTENELTMKTDECKQTVQKLDEAKADVEKLTEDLAVSEQAQQEATKCLEHLKHKQSLMKEELQSLNTHAESAEKTNSEKEKKLHERLVKAEDQLNEAFVEIRSQNMQVKELSEQVETLKGELKRAEHTLENAIKEHESKEQELTQQIAEQKKKVEAVSSLEQQLEAANKQLEKQKKEVEKLQDERQEEEAEFSQKLIGVEREKRMIERKAAEWKAREEELTLKCQGLEVMQQEEKQLHEKMRESMELLKSQREEKDKIQSELAAKNVELMRLREELDSLRAQVKQAASMEQLEEEREKLQEAQRTIKDKCFQIAELKGSLSESNLMLDQQESIIKSQDEEILSKGTELDQVKTQLESREKEIKQKEAEIDQLNNLLTKEKWELEKAQERMQSMEEKIHDLKEEILAMKRKHKSLEEELDKGKSEITDHNKLQENLEEENKQLQKELKQLKIDIKDKEELIEKLEASMKEIKENKKTLEKEIQKQERTNQRNREEMEIWKKERDTCVSKLEELFKGKEQENVQLIKEVEKLKKDNATMAQNLSNVSDMKDSVIADLRKSNNTLSIQLARVQGMSPPPKMDTPDAGFPKMEFIEDLDTTGHLEMDATPPIAAKKNRKRLGRQNSTSSCVDPEPLATSTNRSLRPIEERNEVDASPCTSKESPVKRSPSRGAASKVARLASDVIVSLSPLTRSAKKNQEKTDTDSKKKSKKTTQAPFNIASYVATDEIQNENQPMSMRRSSRLRTRSTRQQSIV